MGTKRTRPKKEKSVFEAEVVAGRDNAPKKTNSDMPRKFARILDIQENYFKKPKQKNLTSAEKFTLGLKIQPGEKLNAFNHRVNMILGNPTVDAPSEPSKKKEKRKARRQERKTVQDQAQEEEKETKEFHKLTDKVRFGEVAMAPPTLTAKPKDRAKNKRELLSKAIDKNQTKYPSRGSDPELVPKAKKHIKTPAEKRIVEAERVKFVAMYRKLKSEQSLENY